MLSTLSRSVYYLAFTLFFTLFGISACHNGDNNGGANTPPPVAGTPTAAFDPGSGIIPNPNNLLINPQTGKLDIPNPDNSPTIAALNQLDGFSTSAPITTTFGTAIDPASLSIGGSIHVFEVNTFQGAVASVISELTAADITAAATGDGNKTLALVPLKPLKPNTSYMVVLTGGKTGIKDSSGNPMAPSGTYLLLRGTGTLPQSLFPTPEALTQAQQLQALIGSMENAAANANPPVTKSNIILSWFFTTQSISTVLDNLSSTVGAGTIVAAPVKNPPGTGATLTTKDFNPALAGIADVYIGTLDVPYYLGVPTAQNPLAPITNFWSEPLPATPTTLTIPLILTIPNAASGQPIPVNGWPIVIYQHGITRQRTDMLIHADSLAAKGFATIAIDLPLHGLTDTSNPLHASNTPFTETELTFDLDLLNNTTNAPGPDAQIDPSGAHFINLQSLLTSRDNIRQGVVDLLVLRRSLGNIPGVSIDTSRIGFLAHSLGGVVGIPYLAVENQTLPSSLVTTGGGIAQLLNGSAGFGPVIRAGLTAANGGTLSNADLQAFLVAAQTVLDSADPINYGAKAASKHPIHMIEVVGDGTNNNLPDQTIPNTVPQRGQPDPEFVPPSPLAGTEPLIRVMGLQPVDNTVTAPNGVKGIVRFTQGEHGTLLTPSKTGGTEGNIDLLNVFTEMHTQIAHFMDTEGTEIKITESSIILPAAIP